MPRKYKSCVRKVMKTIKPRKKGQTKEQAAHAACTKKNVGNIKQYRAREKRAKKKKLEE